MMHLQKHIFMNHQSWLNNNTWIISDTHFGHKNIVKYENRPENHNELMVRNWNNVISKHSNVLHLGDVFLCPIEIAKEYVKQLNGNKWLVLGNHDTRSIQVYEDMGFRIIGEPILKEFDKYKIIFSHYPVRDLWKNSFNVHGHIHSKDIGTVKDRNQFYNVCVEKINYTPIQLHTIQTYISSILNEKNEI